MEVVEVIFIVLGVLLLIASCFMQSKETTNTEFDYDDLINRLSRRELSKEETEEIKRAIERILSERTDKIIEETDDYLSKVANEKILSVNEFSKQVMEKLEVNHKEVVFLYNMLNEKEAELKDTVSQIHDAEKDAVLLMKELEEKKALFLETANTLPKNMERVATGPLVNNPMEVTLVQEPNPEEKKAMQRKTGQEEKDEYSVENNTNEILALHRQGKSVIEISKLLGLGQGEVRLVVDLYGL